MIFNVYAATPKITSVLPTTLSCGVDNCLNKTITITGSGFNSDAIVPAMPNYAECGSPITVIGTTKRIVCTIKSQPSPGPLTLNVKNQSENLESSVTKANFSLSFAAPKVSSVSPATVSCGVNDCLDQEITIKGSNFRSGAIVPALTSDLATCDENPNPAGTEIKCKLKAQTKSTRYTLAVRNAALDQTAAVSSPNLSIFLTPLAVTSISPTSLTCGIDDCVGQIINIKGTGFKSDATVPALSSDGVDLASCLPNLAGTQITCTLKAQSASGSYKLAVKNVAKSQTSTNAPVLAIKTSTLSVTSVTPASITCGNDDCVGQKIVLKGTGFRSDATVPALTDESVDLATCLQPNPAGTEMTCTLNAQNIAKTHTLFVKNVAKDTTSLSSVKLAIGFALPKITSISRPSITCGINDCDGEKITINGTGFRNDATVPALTGFGSCELLGEAGTKIECTLNAQAASRSFRLAVKNDAKSQTTVVTSDNFSVKVTPFALTSVSPSSVSCGWNQCEGEKIKVIGTGLKSGTVVSALPSFADCDENPNPAGTEISCTLKSQASSSSYTVNVSNPTKNLYSNKITPNFVVTLKALPSITSFNFDSRPNCKGYKVTITGTNLGPNASLIDFPGTCEAPTDNGTKISCLTSKQNSAQAYNVRISNLNTADINKPFVSTASKKFTLSTSSSCPSLSISPADNYYVNQEIPNISPTVTGFTPTSFSIQPALPDGLYFNSSTGVISGTLTSAVDSLSFNIAASDSSISLSTNISLSFVSAPNGVDKIFSNPKAFAAIKTDGTVVTWGHGGSGGDSSAVQNQLTDVKTIFSTGTAFAALKNDKTVVTWGNSEYGGNSFGVQNELVGVENIYSNSNAFAAITDQGNVVTWGPSTLGGDSSAVKNELVGVKAIYSTGTAFAALKNDNSVVTWGSNSFGGNSSAVEEQLINVKTIVNSLNAFAALTNEGTVVTWGNIDSLAVQDRLTEGVVDIFATQNGGFAALKSDDTVVTWGSVVGGRGNTPLPSELTNVKTIFNTADAFAAIKRNNSVVTWGSTSYGGDSSSVQNDLVGVQNIFSNDFAFAAITDEGKVVTWGGYYYGGDSSAVQEEFGNGNTLTFFRNAYAFAALKTDKTVVTWGFGDYGGDSSAVQELLKNVKSISSTSRAFAAVLEGGSVITWGDENYGGDFPYIYDGY